MQLYKAVTAETKVCSRYSMYACVARHRESQGLEERPVIMSKLVAGGNMETAL